MFRSAQILTAGLAMAALFATAGCGGKTEVASAPSDTRPGSMGPIDPAPHQTPQPTATTDVERAEPFKRFRGAFRDTRVFIEVYPIERGATTATANVRFYLTEPATFGFNISKSLNDRKPELGDKNLTAPDGLRLIDPEARKAYLPATIGDGECLCSPRENVQLDEYDDVTVSVTFAAPPPSVTTIDLMVPGFGTVSNVPLH